MVAGGCGSSESAAKAAAKAAVAADSGLYRYGETAFKPGRMIASKGNLLELTLAVNDIYCEDTACVCVNMVACRKYTALQKALLDKYNIKLNFLYFEEVYELEKALKSGKCEGTICKPWRAYSLMAEIGADYKRIADVLDPDDGSVLEGVFMVKVDSPIKSAAEISGKILVMGESSSYEKNHAALRYMREHSIVPAKVYTKASCLESIGEMLDGRADVAVVSDYTMTATCAVDIADPEDFRILAKTEKIPLTSVILDMKKVSGADALRLQSALLGVSGKNASKELLGSGFIKPAAWIPVMEKQFDEQ